ncbi:hypothetical protein [Atlantibacter hermannii]|uniref:hypothetical protein n=1 Tax=Atlantibacter hermannii TaxID=565 RepID=UPI0028A68E20|nr:hypothetical protein [Atlantibacter hermannii]
MGSTYAVVKDGTVINMAVWDGAVDESGNPTWMPEEGEAVEAGDEVGIGWLYENGVFTNPNIPQPPDESVLYEQELNALNIKFEADKAVLASAYLNAILFDGVNEQQKRDEIYQKLTELNAAYDQQAADLEIKYGG